VTPPYKLMDLRYILLLFMCLIMCSKSKSLQHGKGFVDNLLLPLNRRVPSCIQALLGKAESDLRLYVDGDLHESCPFEPPAL
jgi:hypothetical protein